MSGVSLYIKTKLMRNKNWKYKENIMKIAFLFPGQGAQYVGMGKDLYDKYEEIRNIYNEIQVKDHNIVGYILRMLPYLNNDNILCLLK